MIWDPERSGLNPPVRDALLQVDGSPSAPQLAPLPR
jgi:hypothetical protein